MRRIAALALVLALGVLACVVPPALADSGGATVQSLPESESLQVSAEVHHECSSGESGCYWYASAAVYSAGAGCPYVFDATRGVWIGSIESSAGTSFGSFSFTPYELEAEVVVCLYVNADGSSSNVGQSHPFNRRTGSESCRSRRGEPPRGRPSVSASAVVGTGPTCS